MENLGKILKEASREKLYRNPLHVGALRNQPCICGSGKKIKQCHGEPYAITLDAAKAINQLVADYGKKSIKGNNIEGQHV